MLPFHMTLTLYPVCLDHPRSTCHDFVGKIPTLSERAASDPRPLVSLQFTPPIFLLTDLCPLTCPDPVGVTAHYLLNFFSCNTYGPPRKCCKQKTYGLAKPFRCNTYKKHGVGVPVMVNQESDKDSWRERRALSASPDPVGTIGSEDRPVPPAPSISGPCREDPDPMGKRCSLTCGHSDRSSAAVVERRSRPGRDYALPTFPCRLLHHPSAQALGNRGFDESAPQRGIMKRRFFVLAILLLAATAALAQTLPPPLISPEVHSDNRVTFRFRAPNDKEVAVSLEGVAKPFPMQKDDQGVWSVTTEPLAPDYYGYTIIADGVGLFDPSNHAVKPNFLYRASELHVPGPASLSWEIGAVPHGEIHHHFYKSGVVGDDRGYFVYTPPGYDPRGKQTYPVLYLLHGFSDDASAWTAVGRANVILDNLIAQGKARHMIVVMPLGYGAPEVLLPNSGVWRDLAITERNFNKFREALLTEVVPRVEAEYAVIKDRNSRAIAGLSMGGSESLLTGLNMLDEFAWIGAFSSGGITEQFDIEFPAVDSKTTEQLQLLWIACGKDDRLIDINRKFRAWLASKNIKHVDIETPGAHTWMVWRRNLTEFSSLLFR